MLPENILNDFSMYINGQCPSKVEWFVLVTEKVMANGFFDKLLLR